MQHIVRKKVDKLSVWGWESGKIWSYVGGMIWLWDLLRVFNANLPIFKESQIICTYNLEANCFFVKCLSWLLEMGGYGFKSCSWSHLDCASSGGLHFISPFHVFHFYFQLFHFHFHLVKCCTLHFTPLIIIFILTWVNALTMNLCHGAGATHIL